MTEELAFLDAIRAAPHDDAPRLIYADWLTEQHNEAKIAQGEFIRLQIEREALEENSPEWRRLEKRELDLSRAFEAVWCEPLTSLGVKRFEYERGLPRLLHLPAESLIAHQSQLAELTPGWVGVYVDGWGDSLAHALRTPLPEQVVKLHFGLDGRYATKGTEERDAQEIAQSPWLEKATSLSLAACNLGRFIEPIVAAVRHFPQLRSLSLAENQIDAKLAETLARHAPFRWLHSLNVVVNPLGEGVRWMLDSCRAGVLREFSGDAEEYGGEIPDPTALEKLLRPPMSLSLQALMISGNNWDTLRSLLESPQDFPVLQRLNLAASDLVADDVKTLCNAAAQQRALGLLQDLVLNDNPIGDDGSIALANSPVVENLRGLDLGNVELADAGAEAIAASPRLGKLFELYLGSNEISERGRAALRQSPYLRCRVYLDGETFDATGP